MKTIIEMAREAGLPEAWISDTGVLKWSDLERFAELARADEREACARIAEEPSATTYECTVACGGPEQTFQQRMPKETHEIAKEIRARGKA